MTQLKQVKFTVQSGLVIADPCYLEERISESSRGIIYLPNAAGEWVADIDISDEGMWGDRVSHLNARRVSIIEGCAKQGGPYYETRRIDGLGVDSGQMSIIPVERTPLDYDALLMEHQKYNHERKMLDFGGGVVSSTGFGDGCYEGTVEYDSWGLSKITVQFIFPEEEEAVCVNCGDDATEENYMYCYECWWGEDENKDEEE